LCPCVPSCKLLSAISVVWHYKDPTKQRDQLESRPLDHHDHDIADTLLTKKEYHSLTLSY